MDRKSRNCAALLLSAFFVLLLFCTAFSGERTVSLPQGRQKTVLVFRAAHESQRQSRQEKTKKLLAETSDVKIPEKAEPPQKNERMQEIPKAAEPEKRPAEKKPQPPKKTKPAKQETVRKNSAVQTDAKSGVQNPVTENTSSALGNSVPDKAENSKILAVLMHHIEKHKVYPRQARRSSAEGTCVLRITVSGGRVSAAHLQKKSGRHVLDAACEKLGQKLIGVDVGVNKSAAVTVPVHYSLSD